MDHNRQAVLSSARAYAYDDYLAALFSPQEKQDDLLCLSAYYGEIARIPLVVKDEILAQIRFQWWREALEKGVPTGHPVADTLLSIQKRNDIPLDLLLSLIEQRSTELDPFFFSNLQKVQEYVRTIEIPYFRVRAHLLECPIDPRLEGFLVEVSSLLGALRFCLRLPFLVGRAQTDQSPKPLDIPPPDRPQYFGVGGTVQEVLASFVPQIATDYGRLSRNLCKAKPEERFLFLPLALVRPYLKVLEGKQNSSFSPLPRPLPLYCFWRVLLAAKFGRF